MYDDMPEFPSEISCVNCGGIILIERAVFLADPLEPRICDVCTQKMKNEVLAEKRLAKMKVDEIFHYTFMVSGRQKS